VYPLRFQLFATLNLSRRSRQRRAVRADPGWLGAGDSGGDTCQPM